MTDKLAEEIIETTKAMANLAGGMAVLKKYGFVLAISGGQRYKKEAEKLYKQEALKTARELLAAARVDLTAVANTMKGAKND